MAFAEVKLSDTPEEALQSQALGRKISGLPHVASTSTNVVMQVVREG